MTGRDGRRGPASCARTAFLIGALEAKPDITMPEPRDRLVDAHGVTTERVRLRGRSRGGTGLPGAAPFGD